MCVRVSIGKRKTQEGEAVRVGVCVTVFATVENTAVL